MVLLGIDYGEKNLGLAIASGPLAEPLESLKRDKKIFEKINQISGRLGIDLIVVGISEGEMAEKTKLFSFELSRKLNLPIEFQDETLSTRLAIQMLREGRAKKKKRRGPPHAYAAAIILQEYLDCKNVVPADSINR
jgi:putative Holliday junction resolvase